MVTGLECGRSTEYSPEELFSDTQETRRAADKLDLGNFVYDTFTGMSTAVA